MSGETSTVQEALAIYATETPETERVPPGYKQTEVGVIPEDWEIASLEELSFFITKGSTPTTYGYRWQTEGVLFLRSECVSENGLDLTQSMFIGSDAHAVLRRSEVYDGDLLMTITGNVGRVVYLRNLCRQANINQHIARIRVVSSDAHTGFVFHFLSQPFIRKYYGSITTGQAYPQISLQQVRDTKIYLPPLPEQRSIATALSDVDALIAALDKLIAKKRAVKTAAMQQLLTGKQRLPEFSGEWEERPLGEVAYVNMGQSPSSLNYNVHGVGLPLIQGNADIENRRTIARVWTTQITKSCDEGDVVLTVRAPVGYVCIASMPSCLGRGVCSVKPTNVEQEYLFHALVHAEAEWKILEQGSTFTSANSDQISKFRIMWPVSREEQTAIAAVLSDMDAEITALEARREKTRRIKQGMMQELLTGRTRLV